MTGTWQYIANDGTVRPHMPTLIEYFRKGTGAPADQNYVVLGKTKLDILAYSDHPEYGSAYGGTVMYSASQYDDQIAWSNFKTAVTTSHPRLTIINLPKTDNAGHSGIWSSYISGLRNADSLVNEMWNFVNNDAVMAGKTTMFVTNDHGRHDDQHGGFTNHGDGCEGCSHIMLLAIGPDTPANAVDSSVRQQIDIAPTVGRLLGFATPYATGAVLNSAIKTGMVNVALAAGWNLISNPVTNPVPGDSVRHLYPTSVNTYAFEYSGGYVQQYRLTNGKGYWGKFPGVASNSITGTPRTRDSVSVVAGWNIVGTITNTVDTGTIVSVPPGLRVSSWFGYSGGYVAVTQLVPGNAYWVKSIGTGRFVLANPVGKVQASASRLGLAEVLNTLTITDSRGGSQTLYFGADAEGQLPVVLYAMPPLPPVGGFDARFWTAEGGSMVQRHGLKVSGPVEFPVEIQSDAYPLAVSWNVSRGMASYELTDGRGGQVFRSVEMRGEGGVTITNSEVNRISVRLMGEGQVPREFALSQNFPNPFNPSTSIKFELPTISLVKLSVYDLLGREVSVLVNEKRNGGVHEVKFDASGLSSGVYYYRLQAGDFVQTRKLLFLR